MPGFNGSGTFVRSYNWVADKNASVKITASRMDTEDDGFATGLSNTICRDGQSTITANLPMSTFRHTGVGNAQAVTDYAAAGQVQNSSLMYAGTSSGTDTITAATTPSLTAYAAGQTFRFKAGGTNTGAATLNVSSVGAKAIQKNGTALVAGDITANDIVEVTYDGTQFQMVSPARTPVITALPSSIVGATNLVSTVLHDLTAKASLTGADEIAISDSAASNAAKKITWTNVKAQMTTDFAASTSAAGLLELLTAAEFATGTDAVRAPTAALFAATAGATGTISFPGGVIFKWGTYNSGANAPSVSFAAAFPAACDHVFITGDPTFTSAGTTFTVTARSASAFTCDQRNSSTGATRTDAFSWFAIGR